MIAACAPVLVSGRDRAFSAGEDLKAYVELQADPTAFAQFIRDFHRTFGSIRSMNEPVVALINGVTAAGGLELLLACDFGYAAQSARIGDLHLKFGQIGGAGSLALLPRVVGPTGARELLISARLLYAQEAYERSSCRGWSRTTGCSAAGLEFARGAVAKSPDGVRMAKDVPVPSATPTVRAWMRRCGSRPMRRPCTSRPTPTRWRDCAFAERRAPWFGRRAPSDPVSVGARSRYDRWSAERDPAALRRS